MASAGRCGLRGAGSVEVARRSTDGRALRNLPNAGDGYCNALYEKSPRGVYDSHFKQTSSSAAAQRRAGRPLLQLYRRTREHVSSHRIRHKYPDTAEYSLSKAKSAPCSS